MTLTPGSRLGVFELVDLLGRGGMGEVYRATDTKLKRQVAIKVLPPSMVADRDRLARFQREAEVLASLNHPNIAAIYGLEESEGVTALVMELVEGDDLSQRISRGAIPLDEALPIAKQIAEALEAAHEQGIIHRDLKPANIKVRADGTVKVLDFGLAKALDPAAASSPEAMNSPTITTPAMTQAGMILGTAAYMAPEQAKGKTVDKRADIWAFGAVLFEMLTAKRAFAGGDVSAVLASVLALDGAFETAATQAVAHAGAVAPPWRRALPVAAAVVLTAALVGGAAWRMRPAPAAPAPVAQFSIAVPGGIGTGGVAMSPDGTRTAFSARSGGLYLRAIGDVDAHLVPGVTPGLSNVGFAFSPDGESVVFYSYGDGSLKRIPVAGGQALTIAQGIQPPSGLM